MVVETGHIFSNILQASTKIIQNHSLAILQTEKLHCNLLQAKSSCSLKKTEMINLAENNKNLPKRNLADHCIKKSTLECIKYVIDILCFKKCTKNANAINNFVSLNS